jgi:hypothetical protein
MGPHNAGSWVFVACVLDGATGTATHYFNGEKIGARHWFVRGSYRLASAEIGNLPGASRKPGDPPSNFDGSIDELAILSVALTPDAIARLYEQGKPNPN